MWPFRRTPKPLGARKRPMTKEEVDAVWAEVTRSVVFKPPTEPIPNDRESLLVETLRWWLQANVWDGLMRNSALGQRTMKILTEYDGRKDV